MPHTMPDQSHFPVVELLSSLDALTRQRDSTLVRLNAMQALLTFVRPETIRLYDVVNKGDKSNVILFAWSEGETLHYSEGALSEDRYERIDDDLVMEEALGERGRYACGMQDGYHECCVPVRIKDETVSLFRMKAREPFADELMSVVTGMVTVYSNYLDLLEDSQRDTLTRLLNRKTFDEGVASFLSSAIQSEALEHELPTDRRSHREGSHWLAVMDIDHFKRVNDTFGHLYGDEVLILMAELMRVSFRQADRMYRFGGEEFVVLLRDVPFDDAKRKLEFFRETVAQHVFPQVGQVTISIGFTAVTSSSMPSSALGEADEALYYAKEHGRNQVCCYGELLDQNLVTKKTVHTEVEFF